MQKHKRIPRNTDGDFILVFYDTKTQELYL